MRANTFLFGRLNVLGQFTDKAVFVGEALQTRMFVKAREFLWGFFDVDGLHSYPDYITGYLVKLSPQEPEEIGNLATHELTHTNVPNRAIAKSRFFLHVPTGLIAHQKVANQITDKLFREYFARLFEEAKAGLFVSAEIQVVQDQQEFLAALHRFARVDEVVIKLHPTNPHFGDEYRSIDERLKALEVSQYREHYLAAPHTDGLDIRDDDDVRRKALMAEDGYGEAMARGILDNDYRTVTTGANPVSSKAFIVDGEPASVLEQLLDAFQAIMERMSRE